MKPPIDLHLVSWNRPKMTELVIRTIHRNTKPGTFRIIVLDNGSDVETIKMLDTVSQEGLISDAYFLGENIGLEAAREYLRVRSQGEYFICVDNDCLPQPIDEESGDWIERLVELMQKYEDVAAISCRTQVMIGTGNIFEEADQTLGMDIVEFPHPGGSLRIMRAGAVEAVGGWDRDADGRGAEERYICGKLRDAGYRTAFATHIRTLHLFGTRSENNETDRWGYDKDMRPEETGHSDIWHPALAIGDDFEELVKYAGEENAKRYYS